MAIAEQKRSPRTLLWVAVIVLLIVLIFVIRAFSHEKVLVRVAPVTYQTLSSTVGANGKVEPIEEFQAHAPAAGIVEKIPVSVGQHVTPGTLLIQMEDADARARMATSASSLAAAQASLADLKNGGNLEERNRLAGNLAAARLEQQQAAANLAAVTALQQKGAASAGEVAAAQQRLDAASLSLRNATTSSTNRSSPTDATSANARIADAQASYAAARGAFAGANVRSPIAGTVYYIRVSPYDFVPAGDELLNVADLTRLQIRAYFDEPDVGKLAKGQAVKIVWDARPGMVWHGHIELAPTTIQTYGTRNVGECLITVDDAKGDLLPNTNVTVTVTESQRFNVLSVPREALRTDGLRDYVYRIINGHLARTTVEKGVVNLTSAEITSGLTANDVVVLGPRNPGEELSPGLQVKPVQ